MTAYRCWIEFPNDKPLQLRVHRGELGEPGSCPLQSFPASPDNASWPGVQITWCRERELTPEHEGLTVKVKVKKAQIQDFVDHVYGRSDFYFDPAKMLTWKGRAYLANQLNDLRACVAQQLSPRLWYELWTDEFRGSWGGRIKCDKGIRGWITDFDRRSAIYASPTKPRGATARKLPLMRLDGERPQI